MKCWIGLHAWSTIVYLELREGAFVEVEVEIVQCQRCGLRAMETVL